MTLEERVTRLELDLLQIKRVIGNHVHTDSNIMIPLSMIDTTPDPTVRTMPTYVGFQYPDANDG